MPTPWNRPSPNAIKRAQAPGPWRMARSSTLSSQIWKTLCCGGVVTPLGTCRNPDLRQVDMMFAEQRFCFFVVCFLIRADRVDGHTGFGPHGNEGRMAGLWGWLVGERDETAYCSLQVLSR